MERQGAGEGRAERGRVGRSVEKEKQKQQQSAQGPTAQPQEAPPKGAGRGPGVDGSDVRREISPISYGHTPIQSNPSLPSLSNLSQPLSQHSLPSLPASSRHSFITPCFFFFREGVPLRIAQNNRSTTVEMRLSV